LSRSPQIGDEELVTIIANSSEKFINDKRLCVGLFQWQQSCSAFSVSKRNIPALCEYIITQKEHHAKENYEEEHKKLLNFYQKKSGNQVG